MGLPPPVNKRITGKLRSYGAVKKGGVAKGRASSAQQIK